MRFKRRAFSSIPSFVALLTAQGFCVRENTQDSDPVQAFISILSRSWETIADLRSFEIWSGPENSVTVGMLFTAIIITILGYLISKSIVKAITRKTLKRSSLNDNTVATIEKTGFYLAYFILILIALRIVNIPIGAFAFLGGGLAIGLGFGAKNLINNFISGFIIMAERHISIGDLVEVDDTIGRIQEVNARSTRILTGANTHIIVPNSQFLENKVTNWTLSDREIRSKVSVGIAYGSPIKKVESLLKEAVKDIDRIKSFPEPFVVFSDFGDSALIFDLYFYIILENLAERWMIESDIRYRITEVFTENNIVIAFPQRDIHIDTQTALPVRINKT